MPLAPTKYGQIFGVPSAARGGAPTVAKTSEHGDLSLEFSLEAGRSVAPAGASGNRLNATGDSERYRGGHDLALSGGDVDGLTGREGRVSGSLGVGDRSADIDVAGPGAGSAAHDMITLGLGDVNLTGEVLDHLSPADEGEAGFSRHLVETSQSLLSVDVSGAVEEAIGGELSLKLTALTAAVAVETEIEASASQRAGRVVNVAAGTDTVTIQNLIDNVAAGMVIQLAAGVFDITQSLQITRSDVTVQGAGSGKTILRSLIPDEIAGAVIRADTREDRVELGAVSITAAAGSKTLTVTDASGISVGDVIYVMQLNDAEFLAETGNTGIQYPADYATNPGRYAMREVLVEVVGKSGSTLTLSHELPYTFEAGEAKVSLSPMLSNVKIGGFSIETNYGEPDPYDFSNHLTAWSSIATVTFDGVRDSSLYDILVHNAPSRAFELRRVFEVDGDRLTVDGVHNKGDGGNGYGLTFHEAFASTITKFKAFDVRHAVLFSDASAEHYNTIHVLETNRDINFHGSPDADNTIVVDRMIQDYPLGSGDQWPSVGPGFFPIHPRSTIEANDVTFRYLRAGQIADIATAHVAGGDLDGRGGDDVLRGSALADTLSGGSESDTLTGGGGVDKFMRHFGDESDTITDFKVGAGGDVLVLHGYAYKSLADLMMAQVGADTVLHFGQDGMITLKNVQANTLTSANFQFVNVREDLSIIGQGGSLLTLGSDGNDSILMGASMLLATQVRAGTGFDTVRVAVRVITATPLTWAEWRGVEALDMTGAEAIKLIVNDAFLLQSDNDRVVLRFSSNTVMRIDAGSPTTGALVLEGGAAVLLDSLRSQAVTISDVMGGLVTGGAMADSITGGAMNDTLTGGLGQDRLIGNDGADILDGGIDADKLAGGQGNDLYIVDNTADTITEAKRGGVDEVRASAARFSLSDGVERLIGISSGAQNLSGNSGNNLIASGAAADTLMGGSGNDTLQSGEGNDNLFGNSGNDILEGGGGADTLTGGIDEDRMAGGAGADRFVFLGVNDSGATPATRDRVLDFNFAEGDRIDLSAMDAVAGGRDDAFVIVNRLTGVAGQLQLQNQRDGTVVLADVTGDGVADFTLEVLGATGLTAAAFVL